MPKDRPAPSSRRGFLRAGLVTTVATAVYPALGAASTAEQAAAGAPPAPGTDNEESYNERQRSKSSTPSLP